MPHPCPRTRRLPVCGPGATICAAPHCAHGLRLRNSLCLQPAASCRAAQIVASTAPRHACVPRGRVSNVADTPPAARHSAGCVLATAQPPGRSGEASPRRRPQFLLARRSPTLSRRAAWEGKRKASLVLGGCRRPVQRRCAPPHGVCKTARRWSAILPFIVSSSVSFNARPSTRSIKWSK